MDTASSDYRVYIVRVWQEEDSRIGSLATRFTLDILETGQRFGFTNSQDLCAALITAIAPDDHGDENHASTDRSELKRS